MLQPKRVKYRKPHLPSPKGKAQSGNTLAFGDFGLQALESGYLTARQIEAARRAIVHYLKKGGKIWIRIFPDKVVTKKPAETRMGGGKGDPAYWVAVVKRNRILFEVAGLEEEEVREAFRLASYKLPIKVKVVSRKEENEAKGD